MHLATGSRRLAGDTAEMIAARAAFLAAGHYAPITRALAEHAAVDAPGVIADVGAGTGQHLAGVLEAHPDRIGVALDSSTPAMRRAARAHPRMAAVTCDAWDALPLADAAAAVVLSVFAPRGAAEIRRVLAPGGVVLAVTPTERHLAELREPLGLAAHGAGQGGPARRRPRPARAGARADRVRAAPDGRGGAAGRPHGSRRPPRPGRRATARHGDRDALGGADRLILRGVSEDHQPHAADAAWHAQLAPHRPRRADRGHRADPGHAPLRGDLGQAQRLAQASGWARTTSAPGWSRPTITTARPRPASTSSSGHPVFVFLEDDVERRIETEPGDYVYVPPYVPHREENPSPDEEAVVVLARSHAGGHRRQPAQPAHRTCPSSTSTSPSSSARGS